MKRKLHNKAGFSLAELLLTILIMLMVTAIVAAGIPAARNAYEGVMLASNAELLRSTTISALRNELGVAQDIEVANDGKSVTYFNPNRKTYSKIEIKEKTIELTRYYQKDDLGKASEAEQLVTTQAETNKLYITCKAESSGPKLIILDEELEHITFSGLLVVNKTNEKTVIDEQDITIRLLGE